VNSGAPSATPHKSPKNNLRCSRWLAPALLLCLPLCFTSAGQTPGVAITFDDLPAHGELPAGVSRSDVARNIIRALQARGVPGVYGFVNGGRQEGDPDRHEVLRLWRDAGFPLGSHTYSHLDLTKNTAAAFARDIRANEATLRELMGGGDWRRLRYPFLHEGDTLDKRRAVRAYLAGHGYRVAQVTLDFEDYAWNNPYARCVARHDERSVAWLKASYLRAAAESIALGQRMAVQLYGRDIKHVLLLHMGAFDSVMLPDLLQLLEKQGFHFISLEDAESDPAYQTDPDAALPHGGTLLEQFFDSRRLQYPPFETKPLERLGSICR